MSVPKKIHFIWAGGTKLLPEENAKRIKEWAKKNPGFEVNLWIDEKTTPPELLEQYKNEIYAFNNDPKIVLKDITKEGVVDEYSRYHIDKMMPNYGASSDILRYAILSKFGGVYFDSDIVVDDSTLPLNHDGLFDSDKNEIFKVSQISQNIKAIGNDGFICTANNPLMKDLYESVKANHKTTMSEFYKGEYLDNYDSINTILDKSLPAVNRISRRFNWTLGSTGPNAVRHFLHKKGLIDKNIDPDSHCQTTDPDFALDDRCFRATKNNEGNWFNARFNRYASIEDAIKAAVKEIHFETKHMGALLLDYHLKVIMQNQYTPDLSAVQIADKLIAAINIDPPDISEVMHIQLNSKYSVISDYYRNQAVLAPILENHLKAMEDESEKNIIQRFKNILMFEMLVDSGQYELINARLSSVDNNTNNEKLKLIISNMREEIDSKIIKEMNAPKAQEIVMTKTEKIGGYISTIMSAAQPTIIKGLSELGTKGYNMKPEDVIVELKKLLAPYATNNHPFFSNKQNDDFKTMVKIVCNHSTFEDISKALDKHINLMLEQIFSKIDTPGATDATVNRL